MSASAGGRAAVGAAAEHGQVTDIGLESLVGLQGRNQRPGHVRADLGDLPAAPADQVHVVGVLSQVVGGGAVPEVGVGHHAQLFEQLQRAVDGGDVDAAGRLAHL